METKTPDVVHSVPPYGHAICSEKWRNSSLIQSLKGGDVKILFESELGVADFHLPNKSSILYVSECDVIAGNGYKRKLVRYRNAGSSFQQLVLVERTRLSEQYFSAMQKFVVFDLGLSLLPVGGQTEASQLITQIPTSRTTFINTKTQLELCSQDAAEGSRGRQREPFQEKEYLPAAGSTGSDSGPADPWGWKGQSSDSAAELHHPAALQCSSCPVGAHGGPGQRSADPQLFPQVRFCWKLKVTV
ncbi:Fanconi anemia core complex-associated protein 24 isoform 1-T1 [Odontesthes bonariensis]|uniref:Fanconi anemia core complex-associated protein 24 isoform X1 n=1 Tax=Odontesthes bonariensis TaxID=219752 RepID=UPI003F589C65